MNKNKGAITMKKIIDYCATAITAVASYSAYVAVTATYVEIQPRLCWWIPSLCA